MDITLSELGGRTLTLRTATMLLHTSTPPTNSAWMPSLSRTCLKSDRRGSLINTDWCPGIWRESRRQSRSDCSSEGYWNCLYALLDTYTRSILWSSTYSKFSLLVVVSPVILCSGLNLYLLLTLGKLGLYSETLVLNLTAASFSPRWLQYSDRG